MRGRATISETTPLERYGFPQIKIYDFHQDDPTKCTATKLERLRLAQPIHSLHQIPPTAIVLNPTGNKILSIEDRQAIEKDGLVCLDCSWNQAGTVFQKNIRGENRRLPTLLAGNPTNYSVRGRLSTVEALAAALIITGFNERAHQILSVFRWGKTFLTLNEEPLREYAKAFPAEIFEREREFFPE